jgi:sec-independent protein translocase protein TatA
MIGDLFDSPWKILIVAVVIIVLFGSAKLPAAARSLGKSMRILKTEMKDLHHDDSEPGPAIPAPPAVEGERTAERTGQPG